MKKLLKFLSSKSFVIGLILLFQFVFIFFLVHMLVRNNYIGIYFHLLFIVLSYLIVLHVVGSDDNPSYKMAWLIAVLAFPVFGTFFYIFYHQNNITKKTKKRFMTIISNRKNLLEKEKLTDIHKASIFLSESGFKEYLNTSSTFLPSANVKLEFLLNDIKNAKKFIFLEYFIMSEGKMFNAILNALILKVKEGIEIKIIYDDMGSSDRLPKNFIKKMKSHNISVIAFNKISFHINFIMNYRDHRKVVVIDNKIGYTGGINIGDEYTNEVTKYGHWLDSAIRIEGDAVWSLTLIFLENWNFSVESEKELDYNNYHLVHKAKGDGIIIPFSDNPIENNHVARDLFLYLINYAKEEILITTPYLIFDNELNTALKLAVNGGVKVKIVIPNIPDKKLVYNVTESYALELLKANVEIYKYTDGFIHSKLFVVDNKHAIIGTTNLDFRSLYLHFENNIYLKDSTEITKMRDYILKAIDESMLQTIESLEKKSIIGKLFQAILKTFSSIL